MKKKSAAKSPSRTKRTKATPSSEAMVTSNAASSCPECGHPTAQHDLQTQRCALCNCEPTAQPLEDTGWAKRALRSCESEEMPKQMVCAFVAGMAVIAGTEHELVQNLMSHYHIEKKDMLSFVNTYMYPLELMGLVEKLRQQE